MDRQTYYSFYKTNCMAIGSHMSKLHMTTALAITSLKGVRLMCCSADIPHVNLNALMSLTPMQKNAANVCI